MQILVHDRQVFRASAGVREHRGWRGVLNLGGGDEPDGHVARALHQLHDGLNTRGVVGVLGIIGVDAHGVDDRFMPGRIC